MKILALIDRGLAYVESFVIVLLSSGALALGVMQVVLRYVFNTGFPWTEAAFIDLTIWAMFFGGSRAVRDGVHVRVDALALILPRRVGRMLDLASMVSSLALSSFFFYCGFTYVRFVGRMGLRDIETQIPDAVTYAIVPIAMAAFVLRYVFLIVEWARDAQAEVEMEVGVEAAPLHEHTKMGEGST